MIRQCLVNLAGFIVSTGRVSNPISSALSLEGRRYARPRTIVDVRGETMAGIFVETASGAPVEVTGTMAAPGYPSHPPDRLEIVGNKASAILEDSDLRLTGPAPRSKSYDKDRGYQASFDGVIAYFVDCLESGAPFETDAAENLATLRLVEDAHAAADLHRPRSEA